MSDLLSAAAEALSAPEALVERSAQARAEAAGVAVDQILTAWSGGAAVAAPAPTPEPAPVADEQTATSSPLPPAPGADDAGVDEQREHVEIGTAVVLVAEQPEPISAVEPAPLSRRRRVAARTGAIAGAVMGPLVVVGFSPWLAARADVMGEPGDPVAAVDLVSGWAVLGLALAFAIGGWAIATLTRTLTDWHGPHMELRPSRSLPALAGMGTGLVVGSATAAVILGMGEQIGEEGPTASPVLAGMVAVMVGAVVVGWLAASLTQIFGVPNAVTAAPEMDDVQSRLSTAAGLPVVAVAGILLLVLPSAWVFLQFPSYAPLMGMIIAGGILAFAGLSASRPGMRITWGEFLVAAAGIGVIILIVFAVLNARGAGHGEADHSAEGAEAATVSTQF